MNQIQFMETFMSFITKNHKCFIDKVNKRSSPYKKGDNSYKKSINKNIENFFYHCSILTLKELNYNHEPAICEHHSDHSFETENFILHLDAKGCLVDDKEDKDFTENKEGLQIRIGDSQILNHVSGMTKDKIQKGLQYPIIDEKPVITLVAFLKWSYKDEYKINGYGIANCSPFDSDKIIIKGKSNHDLRFRITNKELYKIEKI
jgi:hypothetical protein